MALEIRDQLRPERAPFLRAADGIQLQLHALDAQLAPQPPRTSPAARHRCRGPRSRALPRRTYGTAGSVPSAAARAGTTGRRTTAAAAPGRAGCAPAPRARAGAVPSGRSESCSPFIASTKEYISFSTTSVASPIAAHEKLGALDDGRADLAVAVLLEHRPRGFLEKLASGAPRPAGRRSSRGSPVSVRTPSGNQLAAAALVSVCAGYLAATYCSTICWNSAAMLSPFQRHRLHAVDVDRRDRVLPRARQADADVGVLAFARPVHHAAHHRDVHVLHAGVARAPHRHLRAQIALDPVRQLLEEGAGGAPASRDTRSPAARTSAVPSSAASPARRSLRACGRRPAPGVSETRMVSPMPSCSSTAIAAVEATMPLEPMPASVSPRCSA